MHRAETPGAERGEKHMFSAALRGQNQGLDSGCSLSRTSSGAGVTFAC